MNATIHPLDRVESARIPIKPPGFFRRAFVHFFKSMQELRDQRALAHLSELDDHMLQDIGLTRDKARTLDARPISDGRWIVDNWR